MLNLREESPQVLYMMDDIRYIDAKIICNLTEKVKQIPQGICRICFHKQQDARMHQMLIAKTKDAAYPPHRHMDSEESLFVFEGSAHVRLYDTVGSCTDTIALGTLGSGKITYIRIPVATYHDIVIESEVCVFFETKLGPFDASKNEVAFFASKSY